MNKITSGMIPQLSPAARLQHDGVRRSDVLLYPEGVIVLNSTSHAILVQCNGTNSVDSIVHTLATEFKTPRDTVYRDTVELLTKLQRHALVSFNSTSNQPSSAS